MSRVAPFDAGIHSSAAWTGQMESADNRRSDEPRRSFGAEEDGFLARVIQTFDGNPENIELSVVAGDSIVVLLEDVMEGWSLARKAGARTSDQKPLASTSQSLSVGLILRDHYVATLELGTPTAIATLKGSPFSGIKLSPFDADIRSSSTDVNPPTLEAQTTGGLAIAEMGLKLLRGKSINRFSSFVSSGAEDWILNGDANTVSKSSTSDHTSASEADRYGVSTPPAWKETQPVFSILVHSPAKQTSAVSGAYIRYSVSSIFPPQFETDLSSPAHRITVMRRFSQFAFLRSALLRKLPGVILPPLPDKQYVGRFGSEFVETRRGDLERWINSVVRHPLARAAEVVNFFLTCADQEWNKQLPKYLAASTPGPSFFSRVFYPIFNVDAEEAEQTGNRFEKHTKVATGGIDKLRNSFGKLRERGLETSISLREFSYCLLGLITSKHSPMSFFPDTDDEAEREIEESKESTRNRSITEARKGSSSSREGLMTTDGAWCWKDDCDECLETTKGLQKLAETLQIVSDLHEDHARRTQLVPHEHMKSMAHPDELYAPTLDIHRSTLAKYIEASNEYRDKPTTRISDPIIAARCEAVLNTTMAEFETYHQHKNEDLKQLSRDYLDGEIEFMEQVLRRLRTARRAFDTPPDPKVLLAGPRRLSIYEKDLPLLSSKRKEVKPLTQPTPHAFDSSGRALRPMTKVLQDGVGLLFGTTVGESGSSVDVADGR